MFTFEQYLDHARVNADALAGAAERAGLDAPVPTCPEWNVETLVRHSSRPLLWSTANVEARGEMATPDQLERSPKGEAALPFFREAAATCVATLGAAGPDAPAWGWAGDGRTAFWARRMAHEMAMHRYDAESATGDAQPIDGELAVDGIDEFLELLGSHPSGGAAAGNGETIHLHCTDRDGEWLLHREAEGVRVERQHAKGDVAARGAASDLLLVLVSRAAVRSVEIFGDADVLERWQADVSF